MQTPQEEILKHELLHQLDTLSWERLSYAEKKHLRDGDIDRSFIEEQLHGLKLLRKRWQVVRLAFGLVWVFMLTNAWFGGYLERFAMDSGTVC